MQDVQTLQSVKAGTCLLQACKEDSHSKTRLKFFLHARCLNATICKGWYMLVTGM